jgi:hypothetical protein
MRDIAQVFRTLWERAGEFILFLFLLLSLFRCEIAEGLRIGMAILGRAGC